MPDPPPCPSSGYGLRPGGGAACLGFADREAEGPPAAGPDADAEADAAGDGEPGDGSGPGVAEDGGGADGARAVNGTASGGS
ncbi:hypothetical protein AB0D45_20450 [Streptomyces sp. NPDC048352]|uniref:hypothetical protein n=1 Tax=Streptomyces sp. NPDC048352 TaxID=3154718 RepID=UPI0034340944